MSETAEAWADIDGFPNYVVSSAGEVVNVKFRRSLNPRPNPHGGGLRVTLSREGRHQEFYVHQLVAAAFLDGYRPGLHIRHIDEDKANNHVHNLSFRKGHSRGDEVSDGPKLPHRGDTRVRIIETGEVFLSVRDCARYLGGDYSTIYKCIREPGRRHKGYTFEYYSE